MNQTQAGEAQGRATIRQVQPGDLAALGEFFAGLSLRSRYQRFFAPVTPSQVMLRRMSGGAGGADALVALHAGVIIGHAMAADAGPGAGTGSEPQTDIGVVVADPWQGQGVGSALVRELIRRAQARGVASITMDVLHANHQVLAMITGHWETARIDYSADCLTVHVCLPQPVQRPPPPRVSQPSPRDGGASSRRLRRSGLPAMARHAGRVSPMRLLLCRLPMPNGTNPPIRLAEDGER